MHLVLEFLAYGLLTFTCFPLLTESGGILGWLKFLGYVLLLYSAYRVYGRVRGRRASVRTTNPDSADRE
jgi:hypothetical protein